MLSEYILYFIIFVYVVVVTIVSIELVKKGIRDREEHFCKLPKCVIIVLCWTVVFLILVPVTVKATIQTLREE